MNDPLIICEVGDEGGKLGEIQVCVDASWSDPVVLSFVYENRDPGAETGWHVRAEKGRVRCRDREGCEHLVVGI